MGWVSAVENNNTKNTPQHSTVLFPNNPNAFTIYDEHFLYHGDIFNPTTMQKLVTSGTLPDINSVLSNTMNSMMDNRVYTSNSGRFHDNQPIYSGGFMGGNPIATNSLLHHLEDQAFSVNMRHWLTPGYSPKYTMGTFLTKGIRKLLSLPEIRMLVTMGYTLNPIFAGTIAPNSSFTWANIIPNNHKPECNTNLNSVTYSLNSLQGSNWAEGTNTIGDNVDIDFPNLINNNSPTNPTATQLIIDINTLPNKIFDIDNDLISIIPESIVGIRGVGIGGNNHDRLQLINGNTQVVYTPSPNFIGLAQFYGRLFDGKEMGAIALFTINVTSGNNISNFIMGNQLIVNGTFEEGTELKTQTNQTILGNSSEYGMVYGKEYSLSYLFSDGHPFSYYGFGAWNQDVSGIKIRLASKSCTPTGLPYRFGHGLNHFPSYTVNFPMSNSIGNDRYMDFYASQALPPYNIYSPHTNYSQLLVPVNFGEMLQLEFDLYIPSQLGISSFLFDANFVNTPKFTNPGSNFIETFSIPINVTDQWFHFSEAFQYCGTTPSNFLDLIPYYVTTNAVYEHAYIDNISLKEIPISVLTITNITAGPQTICIGNSSQLNVTASPVTCNLTYNWQPSATLNSSTSQNPVASPMVTTTYTVVVNDVTLGLSTSATITVNVSTPIVVASTTSPNAICIGQSKQLNAGGASTYAWQPGGLSGAQINVSPTSTTTYTVTGTDANGCSNTSTITITVNPLPTVTASTSQPTSICIGQSKQLNAGGASTYAWQPGGLSGAQINVSPTSTTTYTVTGTDANGCSNTSTMTITVNPLPTVTAIASPSTIICTGASVTLNGGGASTYIWSGGVQNGVSFIPISTSTYTVTGTDANGCSNTSTITITVLPANSAQCCNPNVQIPPTFTNYSSFLSWALTNNYATLISTNTYQISTSEYIPFGGTVIFTDNVTLTNCPNVVMEKDAQLVVAANRTLTIMDGSVFRAACSDMWKGIDVQTNLNAQIEISGSTVKDMENGILVGATGSLRSDGTNFYDNHISIQLNNINNIAGSYTGYIRGCNFRTMSTNLKNPYSTEPRGEHGIKLYNCRNINIVNPNSTTGIINTFEHLYNGIYIENTQSISSGTEIDTRYNKFFDIQGGCPLYNAGAFSFPCSITPLNASSRGCAIFSENTVPTTIYWINHQGISSGGIIDFERCKVGIMLNGCSADIQNNVCDEVDGGFLNYKTDHQTIQVSNNNITQTYLGILLNGNGNQGGGVNNNTIQVISPPPITYPIPKVMYYGRGIDFSFYTGNPWSGTLCHDNNITSSMAEGIIGINMQNLGLGWFENNNITFTSNSTNVLSISYPTLRGFNISNSFYYSGKFRANSFTGTYSPTNQNRKSCGVNIGKSKNANFICNNFDNLQTGILVMGNCEINTGANTANDSYNGFKGNKFNGIGTSTTSFKEGLLFRHLASTGTLGDIGDINNDNNNTFGNGTSYLMKKVVSVCSGSGGSNNVIYTSPNTLASFEMSSNSSTCGYLRSNTNINHNEYSCSSGQYIPKSGFTVLTASEIADDNLPYTEFEEVADWMDENELFRQLREDSVLRNSNLLFQSFYNQQSQDATDDIVTIDDLLAALNDSALIEASYHTLLGDISEGNENIVSLRDYEMNERIINEIYIRYLEQGARGLTESDAQTIETLAWQCPYIAGSSVYKARSLYTMYNPIVGYDDIDICNTAGVYKNSKGLFDDENAYLFSNGSNGNYINLEDWFKVYPNPTSEMINFEYSFSQMEVQICLYDITGRKIIEAVAPSETNKLSINMSRFDRGVYTYRLIRKDGQNKTGKVVLD